MVTAFAAAKAASNAACFWRGLFSGRLFALPTVRAIFAAMVAALVIIVIIVH
jgi:hypothetical protein